MYDAVSLGMEDRCPFIHEGFRCDSPVHPHGSPHTFRSFPAYEAGGYSVYLNPEYAKMPIVREYFGLDEKEVNRCGVCGSELWSTEATQHIIPETCIRELGRRLSEIEARMGSIPHLLPQDAKS